VEKTWGASLAKSGWQAIEKPSDGREEAGTHEILKGIGIACVSEASVYCFPGHARLASIVYFGSLRRVRVNTPGWLQTQVLVVPPRGMMR
jgi:hypothetical protein